MQPTFYRTLDKMAKMTPEQRFAEIQALEKRLLELKSTCGHVFKKEGDSAVCKGCNWWAGWWCPEIESTCVYEDDETGETSPNCIYCGEPENRP